MRYRLNEADIAVPDGWKDMSINTFVLPAGAHGAAVSLTVTRDHDSPALDLISYTDQQLIVAAKKLPQYRYITRQSVAVSGQPAVQVDYAWRTPEGKDIYQRQAVVKAGLTFLIFTLTSMQQDMQGLDALWYQMLGAVQFTPGIAAHG